MSEHGKPAETWEEFKDKANPEFEHALEHVTGTDLSGRLRSAGRRAAAMWRSHRTAVLIGAGAAVLAAALLSRRTPSSPV